MLELLLQEATDLLKNFDTSTPDAIEETIRRREEILEKFQAIDGRIALQMDALDAEEQKAFRQSKDAAIRKIVETDSLVVALAREQLSGIKEGLAALTQGKKALHAYERDSVTPSCRLNDTV